MAKLRNSRVQEIPTFLREAFDALRNCQFDAPGESFALTEVEINGTPTWVIAAILYDPENPQKLKAVVPLFSALSENIKMSLNGIEVPQISEEEYESLGKDLNS